MRWDGGGDNQSPIDLLILVIRIYKLMCTLFNIAQNRFLRIKVETKDKRHKK